jgi:hypothetical protein
MQLVNIETPQSFISTDLISAIQSRQLNTAKKLTKEINNDLQIFRSFYIVACRQTAIKDYLSSAIVYTDAIIEIVNRLFPNESEQIIQSALDFYCSLKYSEKAKELSQSETTAKNFAVIVSDLEDSVAKGQLEESFRVARKLITVIDSKQYFNELLFEIASKSYTDSGESIIILNSVCKGIELLEWKKTDELIWFALNLLVSEKFKSDLKDINPSDKEIKYAEYVLKSASEPGKTRNNLLFMAHARQVYRAVSVKYKEIWPYLSSFIQKKLENKSIGKMEEINHVKGDMQDFERSLNAKDVQLTMTLVNQIMKSGKTSADIFRSLILYMIQENQFVNPKKIIYLNAARRLAAALEYPRNLHIFKAFLGYIYSTTNKSN